MKHLRAALPLTLILLLAACGGQTSTTPPTETPPDQLPPPTTPTDPVVPAPTPVVPGEGVLYYGEWGWQYQETGDFALSNEGRASITETHVEPDFTGSFGYYQTCYYGNCYDNAEGGVIFGTIEGEGLFMLLFRVDTSNNPVPVYVAQDSDGVISQDSQGRQVFEGQAVWDNEIGDARQGNFIASQISDAPVIRTVNPSEKAKLERQIMKLVPGFEPLSPCPRC